VFINLNNRDKTIILVAVGEVLVGAFLKREIAF
jgi:hypothetical protein